LTTFLITKEGSIKSWTPICYQPSSLHFECLLTSGIFLDCTSLQWFFEHPWSRNHRISWQDDTRLWTLWEREIRSLRLRNCMLEDGCQESTSHHHHQRRPPIDFFLWTRVVRISFFLRTPALLETCLRWVLT
jgi:hypothetical protein